MRKIRRIHILAAVAVLVAAVLFVLGDFGAGDDAVFVPYGAFLEMAAEGYVDAAEVGEGAVIRFWIGDSAFYTSNPRNPGLVEVLLLKGVAVVEPGMSAGDILQNLAGFAVIGIVIFAAIRLMNKNVGKSAMALEVDAAEPDSLQTGFDAVAGNDEAKESVLDVVDFIREPDKYAKYGARMPRGLIFYGPPGTGKTLMARAIAAEAGVPFFATSGSDFVQMYVGVGAKRIRELFGKARQAGRAVVFIDEIDAIGKSRASRAAGGNDEREQTLNALLTEMSGFQTAEGIVVIAATNRLDTLDDALLRPGRFDRQIEIALPDLAGRQNILAVHSRNKPLAADINLTDIAKQCAYFSGAMLENLMNEAAINAAKSGASEIGRDEIENAYYTIVAGSAKKDRSHIKERDRQITAFHEAGHALAAKILQPENTISKITIIPSTKGAAGFCVNIPPDKMYFTKAELEAQIIGLLAGRAAEELIFGAENITTGASNDISRANSILKDYVASYGMGESLAELSPPDRRREAATHMAKLFTKSRELLAENRNILDNIANALLERETINESELDAIFNEQYEPRG